MTAPPAPLRLRPPGRPKPRSRAGCATGRCPFFRGHRPRVLPALGVAGGLLIAALSVGMAAAAELVGAGSVTIAADRIVPDDLYVAAGSVRIDGKIAGDLTAIGGIVNVVGPVDGSVEVAALRAEIRGRIRHSVQTAGGVVGIYGRVDDDVVVVGGSLRIVEGASIGGDLVILGGVVTVVDGATVEGDVLATAGSVSIEGAVRGDVHVRARSFEVAPGAAIGGRLLLEGDPALAISPRSSVAGPTLVLPPRDLPPWADALLWQSAALPRLLALLALGAAVVAIAPRFAIALAEPLRREPVVATVFGLGVVVFFPFCLILLAITLIGVPFAVVGAAGFVAALATSQAVVGLALGRVLLRVGTDQARRGRNLAAMALGVALLSGIRLLPLPLAGSVATVAVACAGLGSVGCAVVDRLRQRPG